MDNKFSKVMAQRTNSELRGILTTHRKDYLPEALSAAESEFANRKNVNMDDLYARVLMHDLISNGELIDVTALTDSDVSSEFFGEIFFSFF